MSLTGREVWGEKCPYAKRFRARIWNPGQHGCWNLGKTGNQYWYCMWKERVVPPSAALCYATGPEMLLMTIVRVLGSSLFAFFISKSFTSSIITVQRIWRRAFKFPRRQTFSFRRRTQPTCAFSGTQDRWCNSTLPHYSNIPYACNADFPTPAVSGQGGYSTLLDFSFLRLFDGDATSKNLFGRASLSRWQWPISCPY